MTAITNNGLVRLGKPKLMFRCAASNRRRSLVLAMCSIIAATIGQSGAAQKRTGSAVQSSAPCTTLVALGAISSGTIPKVGAPYSATVRTTHEQMLADGSIVHGSVTTYQARDAAGRMWEKRSLGCQLGPDGERHTVLQILVTDPGTRTTISWRVDDPAKVYRITHTPARVALPPATTDARQEAIARRAMEEMGIRIEDLGSKSIAGVMADGTRTVNTGAMSQTGNNHRVKIVDETWVAKDLDLAVLRINDNSRTGRTITEVVDLKQSEPEASLFATPAGYSAADTNPPETGHK